MTEAIGTEGNILAVRREHLMPQFRELCARSKVPVSWALAISRRETRFQNVRSKEGATDDRRGGAWGPMQVTSATALDLGFRPRLGLAERGRQIGEDSAIGIALGVMLLARHRKRFGGDLFLVACAYNAGAGATIQGRVGQATRTYAGDVVRFAAEYAGLDEPDPGLKA